MISLIQTAEGALNETHSILQRMRELAVQGANDTNTTEDRAAIKAEIEELNAEITRISDTTQFNKKELLNGSLSVTLQIGANAGQDLNIAITLALNATGLSIDSIAVDTAASASAAIDSIDTAIEKVSEVRSYLGANQNRLDHTINNLNTSSENLTAAESRVRDVDMAKEMMQQTKASILAQASQAMLAQANQMPQGVLQLLR